jgi:hypothetical protein
MSTGLERIQAALADRYRLKAELGAGGMATVYRALDIRHRRDVAIKVLHADVAASIGPERFLREIEIAAGLAHPHITPLLDSGEAEGLLYYVMPVVDGPSLRDRLRREGELPVEDAVAILSDVLDALAYAHGRGIVHRDVKPENVLLAGSHAQLTDFGIAKALHEAARGAPLTATGIGVGTPAYMAPEQAAGDPQADHRADLYAVGVVAYEMLTGAPPFAGAAPQQLIAAHLARTAEPLGAVRPSVPPAIAAAVMRCLEKRPADRWQSAEQLRQRLTRESWTGAAEVRVERRPVVGSLRITEELCRRLDRRVFDPRMIGDELRYLDNQVPADVLVLMIERWGLDASVEESLLRASPYRVVAPTLFGFDAGRKVRFALGVRDHLVLLEALLRDLTPRIAPRFVVAAGFSAGGDLVLRLAAEADPATKLDGCLALGANLGVETCNVTSVMAGITSNAPDVVLPALNGALASTSTVSDWINLGDYLVRLLGNFRSDLSPIRAFAEGILEPWEAEGMAAFVRWYRDATGAGRRVRCVFEDNDTYRRQVRELQLRQLEEGILGAGHRPGSIVVEPVAGHFDLIEPERLARHLDALVTELRAG